MNIDAFVARHRPAWEKLDTLLQRAEIAKDVVSRDDLHEMVALYRRACSDLNRVRSHTANPEIVGYLNQLSGRGYRFIYQGTQASIRGAIGRLLQYEIPVTFRRERTAVFIAAAAMAAGVLFGAIAVLVNSGNARRLVPPMFFTERPSERVEGIESGKERIDSLEKAAFFSASLYTHNIQVSFLAFTLGALTIIGAIWLLFYNGVVLGAIAALYFLDDVPVFFFAWVGPHGALELPAIVFGAAAGIVAGRALLMPGNVSRGTAIRNALPAVWRMLVATMLTLVLAGVIEGSFSQFSARLIPYPIKIAVAVVLFSGLVSYLFLRRYEAE